MGADPVCAALARATGKRPVQSIVLSDGKGGLGNTFVSLQGSFRDVPAAPADAVTIVQRTCQYEPRVVGVRVGQTLKIVNNDMTLHNLHSQSTKNGFNVAQPKSGMVFTYVPKTPEVMMRLTCDVHSWMHGYVAVVAHPYFAVSGTDGAFTIANVPPGQYTVKTWHERFGEQTRTVTVAAGRAVTLDISYNPTARPQAGLLQDIKIPATS
jgi:plastocyanin